MGTTRVGEMREGERIVEVEPRCEISVWWTPIALQPLRRIEIVTVWGDSLPSALRVRSLRHAMREYVDIQMRENYPVLSELVIPSGVLIQPGCVLEMKLENMTDSVQKLTLRPDPWWTQEDYDRGFDAFQKWEKEAALEALGRPRFAVCDLNAAYGKRASAEETARQHAEVAAAPPMVDNATWTWLRELIAERDALELRVAELEDGACGEACLHKDPTDPETRQDAQTLHALVDALHDRDAAILEAANALDAGQAWPDDARKVAVFLWNLLK